MHIDKNTLPESRAGYLSLRYPIIFSDAPIGQRGLDLCKLSEVLCGKDMNLCLCGTSYQIQQSTPLIEKFGLWDPKMRFDNKNLFIDGKYFCSSKFISDGVCFFGGLVLEDFEFKRALELSCRLANPILCWSHDSLGLLNQLDAAFKRGNLLMLTDRRQCVISKEIVSGICKANGAVAIMPYDDFDFEELSIINFEQLKTEEIAIFSNTVKREIYYAFSD